MLNLIGAAACLLPFLGSQADKDKPSTERREAGTLTSKGELLVRPSKDGGWERISAGGTVRTSEALVSLPGSRSELRLANGVNLLLWGAQPEMELPFPLLESAVTLHHPPTGLDGDLTLHRGRVYLTNRKEKGAAQVRLRFWKGETWDVTLEEPDTRVGAELFSGYPPNGTFSSGEEPVVAF